MAMHLLKLIEGIHFPDCSFSSTLREIVLESIQLQEEFTVINNECDWKFEYKKRKVSW